MQDWIILANMVLFTVNSCFLAFLVLTLYKLPQRVAVSVRNYINQLGREPKPSTTGNVVEGLLSTPEVQEMIAGVLQGLVGRVLTEPSKENIYGK